MGKAYYKPREAAAKLGITPEELVHLVREKRLHVRRDGEQKVLIAEEVDALAGGVGRMSARFLSDTNVEDAIDLSRADPSVLEGGGSGLLELTRERYDTSLGDVGDRAAAQAPAEAAGRPGPADKAGPWMTIPKAAAILGLNTRTVEGLIQAGELESRRRPDGQTEVLVRTRASLADFGPAREIAEIQVERTALDLAKRLTETREGELNRARRIAAAAWALVAALVIAAGMQLWWGLDRGAQLEVQRATAAGLSQRLTSLGGQLTEEKARTAKLADELSTVRGDLRSLQAKKDQLQDELLAAGRALAESKAAAQVLAANLEAAKATTALLTAELERAKAATQPTTQAADSRPGT
ncbi:MAG: hypothetical protein AMJ81_06715 [Phycisphaerae bacterium SM23_33]|jgi:hypothetical protein|nr:MAG: hypothetical protein AMJ81_06715 [Phycisphaerae bacterium SM23_33]